MEINPLLAILIAIRINCFFNALSLQCKTAKQEAKRNDDYLFQQCQFLIAVNYVRKANQSNG